MQIRRLLNDQKNLISTAGCLLCEKNGKSKEKVDGIALEIIWDFEVEFFTSSFYKREFSTGAFPCEWIFVPIFSYFCYISWETPRFHT